MIFLLLVTNRRYKIIVRNDHRHYIKLLKKEILIKEIKYHPRIRPAHKIPKIK